MQAREVATGRYDLQAQDPRMAIGASTMRSGLEPWGQVRRRPTVKPRPDHHAHLRVYGGCKSRARNSQGPHDDDDQGLQRDLSFEVVCFARDFDIVPPHHEGDARVFHKARAANRSETSQREGRMSETRASTSRSSTCYLYALRWPSPNGRLVIRRWPSAA